jgi:two-component system sensor histidine kinase/response regulator
MTFRVKTIIGIALIEIVLLVLLVTMSLNYLSSSNEDQLRERANSVASLIAKSAQDAVLSFDLATLDSLLQHILTDPEIVYIKIANNDQVLAEGGNAAILTQARTPDRILEDATDGIFDVVAPIESQGRRYGTVSIGFSTTVIENVLTEAQRYMWGLALGEVALVALFSFVLGTYLTRQLKRLEKASAIIRDSGPGHQVEVRGNDEIAHTMRAFNDMSSSLAAADLHTAQTQQAYRQLAFTASANEAVAKATLSACLDGIVTVNVNDEIVEYSSQAEQIFGWTREEAMGSSMAKMLIPEEMREAHAKGMSHYLATGEGPALGQRLELPAMHRDGHRITVEISIAPIDTQTEILFTAFIRDITEQKKATEAIVQAQHDADQANLAKSRFLATMSHEIRSPLNAVINMNELLLESPLSGEQKELARIAREGGLTLLSLINDILDFSRIESGKFQLDLKPTDPGSVVQSVVELHSGIAFRRGIAIQTVIHPTTRHLIHCDEMRLRQIATNLVSNALKFTHQGGVIVRLAKPDESHIELVVHDSGEGIEPDRQEEIFKEFHQLEDSDNRRFSGSGLGLAITRRLVDLMDGEIRLDSAPGQGSRFVVRLPYIPIDQAQAHPAPEPLECSFTDAVMVNLDNPVMRQAVIEACRAWGIRAFDIDQATDEEFSYAHPVMLVDSDPAGEQLPNHQLKASRLAPVDRWRFISISPAQVKNLDYSPEKTGYFAVLRSPIRAESLINFVCQRAPKREEASLSLTSTKRQDIPELLVLLVDDSSANLAVGEALLKRNHCRVQTAIDGKTAVELSQQQSFDAIFMDLAMPLMDGLEATQLIRTQSGPNQHTPIIALTANAFAEDRERCLSQGMTDYLSKPIDRKKLETMLEQLRRRTSANRKEDSASLSKEIDAYSQTFESSPDTTEITDASDHKAAQRAPGPRDDDPGVLDFRTLDQLKEDTSHDAMPEIIGIFVTEVEKRVPAMASHHANADFEALGMEAHALKSSSASFGAPRLAEQAKAIEFAARAEDTETLSSLMNALPSLAQRASAALNAYLEALRRG